MKRLLFLYVTTILITGILLFSCSRETNKILDTGLPLLNSVPPNPLEGRENPLRAHIRSNWTNGDTELTGGAHYSHIKIYGMNFKNLETCECSPDPDADADFIAEHYDMYMWGGPIVKDAFDASAYPTSLWLHGGISIPHIRGSWEAEWWLNDPVWNVDGYTWDDITMHYMYDNSNAFNGSLGPDYVWPGWNPQDEFGQTGCRKPGKPPKDPNRTAECITDAEVKTEVPGATHPWWNLSIIKDPTDPNLGKAWLELTSDKMVNYYGTTGTEFNGVFLDNAAFFTSDIDFGLDETFTYETPEGPGPANISHYLDKLVFVPYFTEATENKLGWPNMVMVANLVNPHATCNPWSSSYKKDDILSYIENILNERWISTNDPCCPPLRASNIPWFLDCPFLDYMDIGKGYIFTCRDPDDSDRGKTFSLATFYMINHQMAFYYYLSEGDHMSGGEYIEDFQWNPLVEFHVGQPNQNQLGLPDFQGNTGTNLYFVWENGPAENPYKILGREYLRNDGKRVLILSKIMADGESEGQNPTTHLLPLKWYRLMPDMTWSEPLTYITLENNEGAILLKYIKDEPPPDPYYQPL